MIRLFVGCAPNHEDAESQSVFEWSVRKHASEEIEIRWLKIERSGVLSGWSTLNWSTPFTGFRYAVPEMCGFEGRAIYCDSDFLFLDDIAKLWHQDIPEQAVCLARSPKRMCIILWDCEQAHSVLPPISTIKKDGGTGMKLLFAKYPTLTSPFHGNWNCLDGEDFLNLEPPNVLGLHMSHVPTQPHMRRARARLARVERRHWYQLGLQEHPRADVIELFDSLLEEAQENGYPVSKYTQEPVFGPYKIRNVTWEGRFQKV